jgi:hypothetical protein
MENIRRHVEKLTHHFADIIMPRTGLEVHIPGAQYHSEYILRVPETGVAPLIANGKLWTHALNVQHPTLSLFKGNLNASETNSLILNGRNKSEGWSVTPKNMVDLRIDVLRGLSLASSAALKQQECLPSDARKIMQDFCAVVRPYAANRVQGAPPVKLIEQQPEDIAP